MEEEAGPEGLHQRPLAESVEKNLMLSAKNKRQTSVQRHITTGGVGAVVILTGLMFNTQRETNESANALIVSQAATDQAITRLAETTKGQKELFDIRIGSLQRQIDQRFANLQSQISAGVQDRFTGAEGAALNARVDNIEKRMERGFDALNASLHDVRDQLRRENDKDGNSFVRSLDTNRYIDDLDREQTQINDSEVNELLRYLNDRLDRAQQQGHSE